jgi:hypothetical protein
MGAALSKSSTPGMEPAEKFHLSGLSFERSKESVIAWFELAGLGK